jgi:tetratricopeptide (TPR) repeat protein
LFTYRPKPDYTLGALLPPKQGTSRDIRGHHGFMQGRDAQTSNRRLDSWKEIATFFGREERTVKRWEKERGLPVHRVPGPARSGVFAYTAELSEWLNLARPESSSRPSIAGRNDTSTDVVDETISTISYRADVPAVPPASKFQAARITGLLLAILLGVLVLKHQVQPSADTTRVSSPVAHRGSPEAEDFYLKGRYFWNKRTPEDLNKAVDLFTQAIVRDPSFAQAYVGLADCYNLLREYSAMPPSEAYPRALAAAREAVKLDDSSAEAHNSLAFVTFYWDWDAATAEREFKRAIALNPNYVAAHHWYATFLMANRRYPEAITEIETARKLDPSSTAIMADRGFILYWAGQAEGSGLLKQIEAAEPAFLSPHLYLSEIYFRDQDYPHYLSEIAKVAQLRHDRGELAVAQAGENGLVADGAHGMWEGMLPVQKKYYLQGLLPPYPLAQTYSELGDKQEALKYLREAYDKRDASVLFLSNDHAFDTLRGNPSFNDLLARTTQPRLN